MLAIRMQRTGRKGHAQFRVVVQESRFTPTSGRVVANIGSYDPHTKSTTVNKEKADFYLANGAQPSDRAARLLQAQGVDLPSWVKLSEQKERKIRHPEKLRSNQPAAPAVVAEETPVAAVEETPEASETSERTVEQAPTVVAEEASETSVEQTTETTAEPEVVEQTAEALVEETTEQPTEPADEPKASADTISEDTTQVETEAEVETESKPEAK